jgi:putative ABC transport system permease protein
VLIYVLLLLAIIIALIGIVNTLALSIFERTRELGLMRAVGMSRRQMRTAVRYEAVIIALLGTLLGLVLGLGFGIALVTALTEESASSGLTIPVGQLIVVIVLAVIAGIISAILPARRASQLNILQAIQTE